MIQLIISALILLSFIVYVIQANDNVAIRHGLLTGWEWFNLECGFFSPIEILSTTYISRLFIILHFKSQNHQKKTILIARDALPKNEYRRLLVTLKINGLN